MKRLLLYVHFNKNNELSDYVVYQLQKMNQLFSRVVFITNSQISDGDRERLTGLYADFIERPNEGFDFAAWKDGIKKVGWHVLEQYDSVTFMNDTCFGPIYPIEPVYKDMERSRFDFWGGTIHGGGLRGMPGTDGPVPRHIQSYLMVFNKDVVKSNEFHGFWDSVKVFKTVEPVIQNYETQLTPLLSNRYKYGSIMEYSENLQDVIYSNPKSLIKNKFPFIKIKAFLSGNDTLTPRGLVNYLKRHTDMPTAFVTKHINSLYNKKRRLRSVARRARLYTKRAIKRARAIGRGV